MTFTGGGSIVVGGYGMAGDDIGFPLNDDIPLNVHSNQVWISTLSWSFCCCCYGPIDWRMSSKINFNHALIKSPKIKNNSNKICDKKNCKLNVLLRYEFYNIKNGFECRSVPYAKCSNKRWCVEMPSAFYKIDSIWMHNLRHIDKYSYSVTLCTTLHSFQSNTVLRQRI